MTEKPEKPKRPRRSRKASASEDAPAAETASAASASEDAPAAETAARVSDANAPSELTPDEADIQSQEAAAEVPLEADDAAEDVEDAPAKPARRRRGAAEPAEEKSAATAPARRRSRERPSGPPPVVRAQAKYVRSSARKARLVCDHIRGKTVEEARAILAHTPRAVARDWSKLLESAVANAEHNHELVGEDLYVKAVKADEGPTIKRFRPRAMGRATRIRKRTSHLTILLTPKE